MSEWQGKTALVTGASFGIGEAFARRLAAEGANVIVTARSQDRLAKLAEELRTRHGVKVSVVVADLAEDSGPETILRATEGSGQPVDLLINNAGFGVVGDFADLPLAQQQLMIQVNVTALVTVSHLFLQPMLQRRSGAIVHVSSTAAFQGVPYMAAYAATKAFILNFSEGLWAECAAHGVRIQALCPGATATNFQQVAGTAPLRDHSKMQTPEEVVAASLQGLAQNQSVVVSGLANQAMLFAERFVPRQFVTRAAARLYQPFSTRTNAAK